MKLFRIALVLLLGGALGVAAASRDATVAQAQAQTIKVGVLYDLTGPFAAAGAVPGSIGTKIAVDMVNEKGGVLGKYKIQTVAGDSQSKPDVAINEAERLLNLEKVDILLGIYSSAIAVPLAEKVDKQNRLLWITIAIDDRVFKGRRAPATILFMALTLVAVVVYWLNLHGPLWIDYAALIAIGFLIAASPEAATPLPYGPSS